MENTRQNLKFTSLLGDIIQLHRKKGVKDSYDTKVMIKRLNNGEWTLLKGLPTEDEHLIETFGEIFSPIIGFEKMMAHDGGTYFAILCNYKITDEQREKILNIFGKK